MKCAMVSLSKRMHELMSQHLYRSDRCSLPQVRWWEGTRALDVLEWKKEQHDHVGWSVESRWWNESCGMGGLGRSEKFEARAEGKDKGAILSAVVVAEAFEKS